MEMVDCLLIHTSLDLDYVVNCIVFPLISQHDDHVCRSTCNLCVYLNIAAYFILL